MITYESLEDIAQEIVTGQNQAAHVVNLASQGQQECLLLLLSQKVRPTDERHILTIVCQNEKELSSWNSFYTNNTRGLFDVKLSGPRLWRLSKRQESSDFSEKQKLRSALLDRKVTLVLTTMEGLFQKTTPLDKSQMITVEKNIEIDQDEFIESLEGFDYLASSSVTDIGTYCVKGSIIDVFASNHHSPIRIEFFGDNVESIKYFDPTTQKTTIEIRNARLLPRWDFRYRSRATKESRQKIYNYCLESGVDAAKLSGINDAMQNHIQFRGLCEFAPLLDSYSESIFDLIKDHSYFIFPKRLDDLVEHFHSFIKNNAKDYEFDVSQHIPSVDPKMFYDTSFSGFLSKENYGKYTFFVDSQSLTKDQKKNITIKTSSSAITTPPWRTIKNPKLASLWEGFFQLCSNHSTDVILTANGYAEKQKLKDFLSLRKINATELDSGLLPIVSSEQNPDTRQVLVSGDIAEPAFISQNKIVIPSHAIFGQQRKKAQSKSPKLRDYLRSLKDLKVGDLVVHIQHGIGRYTGLTTMNVMDNEIELLTLEYKGGDKIYVPADKINLLQKFSSDTKVDHKSVDKLKSTTWVSKKSKAKKSIKDMAEKLLKIQAQRKTSLGHSFHQDNELLEKISNDFPYTETIDQHNAIEDVIKDLEKDYPMDRLICGDVGFGKTEVAIRASAKVAFEGYQVMILVPTTVLSFQHYQSFEKRFKDSGIQIGLANRFLTTAKIKDNIKKFNEGSIDILIGTHRILSKDIIPSHLGLLIIDEEQRFGVSHKERIREIKANVDTLILTATPIPRTLHMSMLGLKDISIIASPPPGRQRVQTYTGSFDDALIKEALEHEISRGGQAFFLHNRIEDIVEIKNFLQGLVPHARIIIGHGQMPEKTLEKVFVDFMDGSYDILVCTTIIESGIDMPDVNTIIVNNAQQFGLSQLYQIRGRVGRSKRQAFAYLLTPAGMQITEDAQKRLDIIATYQEVGSGFQIASHDLEIRGAGNLIGGEQSGHVNHIGLELYTDLLEEAILEMNGKTRRHTEDPDIKIGVTGSIPQTYIAKDGLRLNYYKKIFSAESVEAVDNVSEELVDQFGKPPKLVETLLKVAKVKAILRRSGANSINIINPFIVELSFKTFTSEEFKALVKKLNFSDNSYEPTKDSRILVELPQTQSTKERIDIILEKLAPLMSIDVENLI